MERKSQIVVSDLVPAGIHVLQHVVRQVLKDARDDPESAFESVRIGKQKKLALRVDINAEDSFKRELRKYHKGKFKNVKVYGEESLRSKNLNLSRKKETMVLVDAIDGTDLLEQGISNWCSAAVFFDPRNQKGKRIMGAFVCLPTGDVYYATSESESEKAGAFVKRITEKASEPVCGRTKVKSIKRASICFYGQKADNFLSVVEHPFSKNLSRLNRQAKKAKKLDIRIFNMAGIPMMLRLIDHRVTHARGIDAVFDLKGQKPHDFVPGAFIAYRAGAVIRTLSGKKVSLEMMEDLLTHPASGLIKYVITSTESLATALFQMFKKGRV
jgi:fructose-1,6-bisphosphatase/inositol monophosphatase family enzyme